MIKKNTSYTIAAFSLIIALAFICSYIEALFPIPIPFPGIKLGLANLVLVLVLYTRGLSFCFIASLVRNILIALTFGNLFMFFYSFTGSLLSILFMWLLLRNKKWSIFTISSVGGIAHNLGQFIVAVFLFGSTALLGYAPILYFSGLITGGLIGFISYECMKRIRVQFL